MFIGRDLISYRVYFSTLGLATNHITYCLDILAVSCARGPSYVSKSKTNIKTYLSMNRN